MRIFFIWIFLFFSLLSNSQNLFPNTSFESLKQLPCKTALTSEEFNDRVNDWTSPTKGSSDVFHADVDDNTCPWTSTFTRKTKPRTGKAMVGFFTSTSSSGREYLQVKLLSPLEIGKTYEIEFWVSRNGGYNNATNNMGVFFSDEAIGNELKTRLEVTPQINEINIIRDPDTWQKITGRYTATSAAEFITIGNFFSNDNTLMDNPTSAAYYYIDDMSLVEIMECSGLKQFYKLDSINKSICEGDTAKFEIILSNGISPYSIFYSID
jgi:hypothetical protein